MRTSVGHIMPRSPIGMSQVTISMPTMPLACKMWHQLATKVHQHSIDVHQHAEMSIRIAATMPACPRCPTACPCQPAHHRCSPTSRRCPPACHEVSQQAQMSIVMPRMSMNLPSQHALESQQHQAIDVHQHHAKDEHLIIKALSMLDFRRHALRLQTKSLCFKPGS